MRILKLTAAVEKDLLRARHERDRKAETIAANIVADVRKRGDSALFDYTKKFDGVDLRRANIWISQREIATARKRVSAAFLRALQHAAHNIRRVAEKQLP
ncbi:MAG: histidinol dehydrogenase, partial [Candidatus Acidiferrum sp.]